MSNKYEITGKIIHIGETQTFASGFTKREIVIEESADKYPQTIKFDTVKEGCDRLDAFRLGQVVTVAFNIRGNEHNGKYYVSLQAWKVTADGQDAHNESKANGYQPQRSPNQGGAPPPSRTATADHLDEEEIPF